MENWYDETPCRGLEFVFDMDPDITRKVDANTKHLMAMAIEVCESCPVRAECLADALQYREQEGIRAGLTPRQRMKLVSPSVLSWSDRQAKILSERLRLKNEKDNQHGLNSPSWRRGCDCAICRYTSTAEQEIAAREALNERSRRSRAK